ncbi:hypothetical protein [Clostridium oryzae]|uniref:Extracellular solute-binding protein n=1 Tax=Clostridium oryzae TaxID=1450648 RepID=A0A1V4IH43_9CLOT|nr:hypothetical protein [Clostridium oryzae]OPJ58995.1 hypothetical protein CLORY_34850 [Clostridium oryzae]
MEHKTFKEKIANMSTKEKINYIVYYYKYYFIVGILIIAALVSFIVGRLNEKETVFNASFIGTVLDYNKLEKLTDEATDKLVKNPNKQEIVIDFKQIDLKGRNQQTAVSVQKLVAQLSVGELDVLVMPGDVFNNYCKQGTFMDIENLKKDTSLKNLSFVKGKSKTEASEKTYGIDVSSLKIFSDLKYSSSNKLILAIPATTKHKSESIKFIKWLISKNSL